jgi:pimeloyl-[acyl-carrier protein] methyl ester esterase
LRLHVERIGRGPDLVLLHGWGLHSGVWDPVLPRLAAAYTVHAVDLPGHGHSRDCAAGTVDRAVESILAVAPQRARYCGWSLGGVLGQRIADLAPSRVDGLALVSTTPCFAERPGWDAAMKAATLEQFHQGLRQDREATLARFIRLNALHGAQGREAIRHFTAHLDDRGACSADSLAATLSWLRDTDLRRAAKHLAAPTVVIHGTRDALAPIEAGRWLARSIPNARLSEIEDCAHLPFFSHADRFLEAMEWLQ